MADRFGRYFTNVLSANRDKAAPGARINVTEQVQEEAILLDDGGAAAIGTTIGMASLRPGDVIKRFRVASTVALAATTCSIGTKALPTKYVNAQAMGAVAHVAGVAEVGWTTFPVIDAIELAAGEELYLTTGGAALPVTAGQKLLIETYYRAN